MKKAILFLALVFLGQEGYAQFLPTGTSTTNERYRSGSLGIGYTALPAFGTNKFMVSGNSSISGNLGLGTTMPLSKFHMPTGDFRLDAGAITIGNQFATWNDSWFGLKSSRSIIIDASSDTDPSMQGAFVVAYNTHSQIQMGMARCNGCYSNNSLIGDAVLRGVAPNLIIANSNSGNIKFETVEALGVTSKIQMMIDKNGSIGIGTGSSALNPLEKLAVNGLIHTKEVKVDLLGWPDYVFAKEYKLPSLLEVEKQIKENGHLANIPSAIEVENNGVLLGEMNKKLLEKVEELTLYIIQMNKEIELLKSKSKN